MPLNPVAVVTEGFKPATFVFAGRVFGGYSARITTGPRKGCVVSTSPRKELFSVPADERGSDAFRRKVHGFSENGHDYLWKKSLLTLLAAGHSLT